MAKDNTNYKYLQITIESNFNSLIMNYIVTFCYRISVQLNLNIFILTFFYFLTCLYT
jgi:hypothetical protein